MLRSFILNIKNRWITPEVARPLGRWNFEHQELKADYGNIDSCGDSLCGKPDYFKKTKVVTNNCKNVQEQTPQHQPQN